jgi:hypothetical protein
MGGHRKDEPVDSTSRLQLATLRMRGAKTRTLDDESWCRASATGQLPGLLAIIRRPISRGISYWRCVMKPKTKHLDQFWFRGDE